MKLFKKMAVSTLLLGGILVSGGLSEETKSSESQNSATTQEVKAKDKHPHHKHHHHHKKHTEKVQPVPVNTTKALVTPPPSGHQGWFVGIRGAYVPSGILEVGYEFNNTFKLRLLGQAGRYYQSYSVDGQTYNHIQFQPRKVAIMADWHPWKNGFRLSGGLAYNADRIRLNHTVSSTLLGQPASIFGTIAATYKFRVLAPYLGLGYDTGSLGDSGISLSADAGFWLQGRVRSSFSLSGPGQNNINIINLTKAHLENLLNKHKLIRNMPMVSIGIRYLI
jgi:hypothetical protein